MSKDSKIEQIKVHEFDGDFRSEGMKCAVCKNAIYRQVLVKCITNKLIVFYLKKHVLEGWKYNQMMKFMVSLFSTNVITCT